MARKNKVANPRQINKTYTLKELRRKIRNLTEHANKWLDDIRETHEMWLWERWNSYLLENGTSTGHFRKLTRMNVKQSEEYLQLLYAFEEDMDAQREMYEAYSSNFGERESVFLEHIREEAKRMYFRYFPPSENEANAFADTVKSSVNARLSDPEYRNTHSNMDIYDEMMDAIRIAGNSADPMQGDSTKFRNIFTAPEVRVNGNITRKRYM